MAGNSKTVGALWIEEYTDKNGKKAKMLSGELDLGVFGSVSVGVFKNTRKEKDNQPDYRIVLLTGDRQSNGSSDNGSTEPEPEDAF